MGTEHPFIIVILFLDGFCAVVACSAVWMLI